MDNSPAQPSSSSLAWICLFNSHAALHFESFLFSQTVLIIQAEDALEKGDIFFAGSPQCEHVNLGQDKTHW